MQSRSGDYMGSLMCICMFTFIIEIITDIEIRNNNMFSIGMLHKFKHYYTNNTRKYYRKYVKKIIVQTRLSYHISYDVIPAQFSLYVEKNVGYNTIHSFRPSSSSLFDGNPSFHFKSGYLLICSSILFFSII